jgi:hypothetical protein
MIALLVTAGLGYAGVNSAQTQTYTHNTTVASANKTTVGTSTLTKDGYAQAKKDADAQYKLDKESCASLSGNAKDICMAEAKGKDDVARAEAAAAYENTPKTRENARIAHAEAAYKVSMEKCDDLAGNKKDVCVKEAKASLVRAKADAKVDRVALDTRKDSASKQSEAVKEANQDKRDADYKVAIEKCDALSGPAKDACIGNAKVQYGKS